MRSDREILYVDMNSFYASVEGMLNPSLQGKSFAVCGSTEERRGIILAKSDPAKKCGVKTGMAKWDAERHCPNLIMVPPQYDEYRKYGLLKNRECEAFTDLVEPLGWDECAMDVTGSRRLFGTGYEIADTIRKNLKEKYNLTASIGVSFSKIIAKLASDMKKPDAITVIDRDHLEDIVWPLPITDMCFVGFSTANLLMQCGINKLGDLAHATPERLQRLLGKNGLMLWRWVNGDDNDPVLHKDAVSPIKSLGHSSTCISDLVDNEEVWKCLLDLSQDLGYRLRVNRLAARGVQVMVRDSAMEFKQFQGMLTTHTQSPFLLAEKGMELFKRNYRWKKEVRALSIRAIQVVPKSTPQQFDMFYSAEKIKRQEDLDDAIYDLRRRFGNQAVYSATLMGDHKMPASSVQDTYMPGPMSRQMKG